MYASTIDHVCPVFYRESTDLYEPGESASPGYLPGQDVVFYRALDSGGTETESAQVTPSVPERDRTNRLVSHSLGRQRSTEVRRQLVHELLGRQPLLLRADEQRQVLRHVA